MGAVSAVVRCPACGKITAEVCFKPENYEGWSRFCHACGHQGLDVTLVPLKPGEWTPDPESGEWSGPD